MDGYFVFSFILAHIVPALPFAGAGGHVALNVDFDDGAERTEERVQINFRSLVADVVDEDGVAHATVRPHRHGRRAGSAVALMETGRRLHGIVALRLGDDVPHGTAVLPAAQRRQRRPGGSGGAAVGEGRVVVDDVDALLRMSAHDAHLLLLVLLVFLGAFDGERTGGALQHLSVEGLDGGVGFGRLGEEDEAASLGLVGAWQFGSGQPDLEASHHTLSQRAGE